MMTEVTVIIAALLSFAITFGLGFIVIPYLRRLKLGQTILEIGPEWHKSKEGTPTMGGIMMIPAVLIAVAAAVGYAFFSDSRVAQELNIPFRLTLFLSGIGLALCMGIIGFIDDYIKVVKKRNLGLTAKQKTFMQLLVSAMYLAVLAIGGMNTTYIPFVGDVDITSGIGLIFWPIALFFIYGFTNAVNLTDGIDGLASSVTLVVACAFMLISNLLPNVNNGVLSAAIAGACVGFIFWNANPAKVFMGDTGSMFLGGAVVAIAFGTGRPVLLILAGITYLCEALSDIIQVIYYKRTKKRFFKMAPIHHHFEKCGWSEHKVVFIFSLFTLFGCLLAALAVIFNL